MATVHITIGGVMPQGVPAYAGMPDLAQTLTSSATNQVSSITATGRGRFCSITALGGHVLVAIGPAPVAASGNGYVVQNGITKDFAIASGDKVAILDIA